MSQQEERQLEKPGQPDVSLWDFHGALASCGVWIRGSAVMAAHSASNIFLRLSVSVYDLSVPCRITLASKSSSLAVGLSVWHVRAGSLVVEAMAPAGPGSVSPTFCLYGFFQI